MISVRVRGLKADGFPRLDRQRLRRRAGVILRAIGKSEVELSIVLTDDGEIRELNRTWRGKDRATDVLSFSQLEGEPAPAMESSLGDVVISLETAARQAAGGGALRPLFDEVLFLLVHGVLHLCGHDHARVADARRMRREEERLWKLLGHDDPPYAEPL